MPGLVRLEFWPPVPYERKVEYEGVYLLWRVR
jgi:hypothetical protein